ncbi:MAG: diguanylate cyclase [Gemmatimonadetes bacterium]|nr:diguanylate cyclase [Gemmatimonadota bacterium]
MSLTKRPNRYRSWSYLESGRDYRPFDLSAEVDRVPPSRVPLAAADESRVQRLLEENVYISLHEHTMVFPRRMADAQDYTRSGRVSTGFEGLSQCHFDAIFDGLLDGILNFHSKHGWKWSEVVEDLGLRLCDLAHQDVVFHARTVADIHRAHAENRVAWIAHLEGAAMIENELDRIDVLYGLGVRCLGVAYSESNALGSGLKEPGDGGLTTFGKQAVRRMNQVGMLIDCSHAGSRTTLDTVAASAKPIALTHIGARALWESNRLAPDEVLEAVAAKGGVIGVEAAPHTTISAKHPRHTFDAVMEHFQYIERLVGIDHVTFGPDTLYGDHVGLHDAYTANLSIGEARRNTPPFPKVDYVEGMENPSEASVNIVRGLVRAGYSDPDIAKVMGGNVLRVLNEVWA